MLWYEGSNTALRASFVRLGFDRQGEVEACAARRVVGSPQAATMRFNDGAADPKSHAGPMRFRGKERIKDLVRLLRRQAYAGIADPHHGLLTPRALRFDGQLACTVSHFHSLDAIAPDVHAHLTPVHVTNCA